MSITVTSLSGHWHKISHSQSAPEHEVGKPLVQSHAGCSAITPALELCYPSPRPFHYSFHLPSSLIASLRLSIFRSAAVLSRANADLLVTLRSNLITNLLLLRTRLPTLADRLLFSTQRYVRNPSSPSFPNSSPSTLSSRSYHLRKTSRSFFTSACPNKKSANSVSISFFSIISFALASLDLLGVLNSGPNSARFFSSLTPVSNAVQSCFKRTSFWGRMREEPTARAELQRLFPLRVVCRS